MSMNRYHEGQDPPLLRGGQGRTDRQVHESAWWGLRLLLLAIVMATLLAACPGGAR
jgi:hypothetical protein